jgi:hypothetical protein
MHVFSGIDRVRKSIHDQSQLLKFRVSEEAGGRLEKEA